MDRNELVEKRNRLAELSVLQDTIKILAAEIKNNELDAEFLLNKYQDKARMRESLSKDFLYSAVMKIRGKYRSELAGLTEEMEKTRLEYNNLVRKIKEQNAEYEDLKSKETMLSRERNDFIEEMKRREEILAKSTNSEVLVEYRKLKSDQELLNAQISQIDKIVELAKRIINTADRTIHNINMSNLSKIRSQYQRTRGNRGERITLTPEYKTSDRSAEYIERISYQIKDLKKMITDARAFDNSPYSSVLESILSQLNKMNTIINDCDYVRMLRKKIEETVEIFNNLKSKNHEQISNIDLRIHDMIISGVH